MVKNYMETLVEQLLAQELREHPSKYSNFNTCPECLAYAKAVALNHLKPFYVTCTTGEGFGEYQSQEYQNLSDVLLAVVQGLEQTTQEKPNCVLE